MSAHASAFPRRLLVIPTMGGLWALVAVLIPTAGAFAGRMMATDLAYQIRAGAVMLDSHRLLDVDIFTFTIDGQPWLNQQWAAQVLLAAIYRAGGWDGIAIMRGILLCLILAVLYRTCRAAGAAPRTAAILTIGGWIVGIDMIPWTRPQLFGFVLFVLALWVVTTRHASSRRIWWIPVLVVPWANLHGSFPLVIVLLGIAWLEDHRDDPVFGRKIFLAGVAAILASLANPFGARVWPYALNIATHPVVVRQIAEWSPPSIRTPTGFIFFTSLLAVGVLLARRSGSVGWVPLLTLGLFAGVGLLAVRGVGWWAIVAPVTVASVLRDDQVRTDSERPRMHLVLALMIVAATLVTLPIGRGRDPIGGGPAVLTYAPETLVSAARRVAPVGSHLFVSEPYASWTEFAAPSLPVTLDSRLELFPIRVWDDYQMVLFGRVGWDQVLDRWDVKVLILAPGEADGLLDVLPTHPEWRLITQNTSGFVYGRP
jgi:hypothetical protein